MTEDLLFEIGVEEIPHEILSPTLAQLKDKSIELMGSSGIKYSGLSVYGTPRRLALLVNAVQDSTEEKLIEKKGPSVKAAYDAAGKPTKALEGFLSSSKAKLNEVEKKEIAGNEYVVLQIKEGGKKLIDILPTLFQDIISSLSFPKTMKWGMGKLSFVRPIRWISALFGGTTIPFQIGDLKSGSTTLGHRLLSNEPILITKPSAYLDLLAAKKVFADPEKRKAMILELVEQNAARMKAKAILSDDLLDTLINLTEFPNAAVGTFEEPFLKLPKEVLISEMIEHQKYIPLETRDGDLINHFIIITNTPPTETIIKGNERVIRSRFSDGKFFFDEDRKQKLEDYLPELKNVLYGKGLGSMFDKVSRIQQITAAISNLIHYDDAVEYALRTASLCKADLVTKMVYEFPELQGIIGYYYALNSEEPINVAISVKEHYWPKYSGDSLPTLKEGILVSLADRFDNLFSLYSKGNYVTGSKDPYGLRRQTLGIIRILIEKKIHLDITALFAKIIPIYQGFLSGTKEEFLSKIIEFITTRIKTVFKEYGFNYDEIDAGITDNVTDIFDAYLRVSAIHEARKSDNFINLAIAFKRVKNIISGQKVTVFKETLLKEEAEIKLTKAFQDNQKAFISSLEKKDYILCVSILTSFRPVVDKFFEDVMVMDKDGAVKDNRVALLSQIDSLFMRLIDFGKIVTE